MLRRRGRDGLHPGADLIHALRLRALTWALLVPGSRARIAAGVLLVALAVSLAWPEPGPAHRFMDSVGYVNWPTYTLPDDREANSHRPAGYPLALELLGTGPLLVHVQTWVSLASFALLGWVLAGPLGCAVAIVVSQGRVVAS